MHKLPITYPAVCLFSVMLCRLQRVVGGRLDHLDHPESRLLCSFCQAMPLYDLVYKQGLLTLGMNSLVETARCCVAHGSIGLNG